MEKTNGAASVLNLTAQLGLNSLPNIGKTVQSANGVSFGETFMKTTEVKSVNENEVNPVKASDSVKVASSSVSNNNVKTTKETLSDKTDEPLNENEMKDLAKEVEEVIGQIKDKIKENFEVTDEEIEEAMEVLGLAMVDLTNGADLRQVIMELTGTKDSIDLLTNVELYDGLKEVTALADDLMKNVSEQFSLTTEQLSEIINSDSFADTLAEQMNVLDTEENEIAYTQAQDTLIATDVKDTTDSADVNATVNVNNTENAVESAVKAEDKDVPSEEQVKALVEDSELTAKTKVEDGNVKPEVKADDEEKQPEIKVEVTRSEEARTANSIKTEASSNENPSKGNDKKSNLGENKNQEFTFGTTQQTQTVTTAGDIVETVTSYTRYADAENIMRQVTDFVKVNISGDVTEMEMQLHPASLGTVNMQINAQNGQITAHLTVQNELVKSILEGQMVELQKTFDEQGTKVTAIEISVANYNLDSKNDGNYSGSENSSRRGNGRKSLNLNSLGSFDELTDEEQLEAKVMEMNGSSVNYTA